MSLLSANISILCDLTCYVCDPSEERGSGAEWDCCTWGYFSPSLKSRTISHNSKQWGSQAGAGAACRARTLQPQFRYRTGTWDPACLSPRVLWLPRVSLAAGLLPALVGPTSAHCHSSCSCLNLMGWPLQQCRTSPAVGGRLGVAWGHARDRELWCGIYFQLCRKLPIFVFGANHSKSLSSVLPLCRMGLSAPSSWELVFK